MVGTAIWSSEFTLIVKVSETAPTLVIVTVSGAPAGEVASGMVEEPAMEPPPPLGTGAMKLSDVGAAVKLFWRAPNRSSFPAPAICGPATLPAGYWSNSGALLTIRDRYCAADKPGRAA